MKNAKLHRISPKFSDISKCSGCNLTYGFERTTNKWKNIDSIIEIFEALNINLEGRLDINKLLNNKDNVSEFKVYYLLGYLLNHYTSITNVNIFISEKKQDQLKGLLSKTKNIPHLKSMTKKIYRWGTLEFFYIYHSSEVQRHIYFGLKESRTQKTIDIWKSKAREYISFLLESDRDITIDEVCNGIGCSHKTLSKSGLNKFIIEMKYKQKEDRIIIQKEKYHKVIKTYIKRCLECEINPNCKKVYSLLGITHLTFKKNYPDVYEFMKKEIDMVKRKLHDKMIERYKQSCKNSIEEIGKSGDRLTYLCILTNAGLGADYCRRYQQLRLYVDNEVSKFKNLNRK